jgi:ADP-ribose pyrophosphatase
MPVKGLHGLPLAIRRRRSQNGITRSRRIRMAEESASPPKAWKHREAEVVGEFSLFRVCREKVQSPRDGAELTYDIVDSMDGVAAIAVTGQGELVLVEQYRAALRRNFLELPAGILDEGEEVIEAGLRELREETGFTAANARLLGTVTLNPSWQTTLVHVIACDQARRTREKELDRGEDTRVRLVPLDDLRMMAREGKLDNAVLLSALALFWANR